MIPSPHRLKGGTLQLGTEVPGTPGPFGTWTEDSEQEPEEPETETAASCGGTKMWC
ncbi:hypothetical protein ACH4E7_39755 [Kitasatospora sp. NPDC018058]|uniref:hypothetical protein n=1 Tax=Kitasatospora sp. NPDC018058 TaxID=3364025 RepID=UPI0037C05685